MWCRERKHASRNDRFTRTYSSFEIGLSGDLNENKKTTTLGLNWRSLYRYLYGHPWVALSQDRIFDTSLLDEEWAEVPRWECLCYHRTKFIFLSMYVDDIQMAETTRNMPKMSTALQKEEPTLLLDQAYLGRTRRPVQVSSGIVFEKTKLFSKLIGTNADAKTEGTIPRTSQFEATTWQFTLKTVGRFCVLAHTTDGKLSTLCLDDEQVKPVDVEVAGEVTEAYSKIALASLYLALCGGPDLLWTAWQHQSLCGTECATFD